MKSRLPPTVTTDTASQFSRLAFVVFLFGAARLAPAASAAELPAYQPDANAPRASVPDVYKWDLSPLFASDQACEQARVKLLAEVPSLAQYQGGRF